MLVYRVAHSQPAYHSAAVVHVAGVLVSVGAEIHTSCDSGERTTLLPAQPAFPPCSFIFNLPRVEGGKKQVRVLNISL